MQGMYLECSDLSMNNKKTAHMLFEYKNEQKKTGNHLMGLIFGIMSWAFIAFIAFFYIKGYKMNLKLEFNGLVEDVQYDIKGIPSVTVSENTYYLSWNDWYFNHRIQKGDSLIKKRNSLLIMLIKQKSGEVIVFGKIDTIGQ